MVKHSTLKTLSMATFRPSLSRSRMTISSWDGKKICSFVQTSGDESRQEWEQEEEERELKPPEDSLVVCSFINGILRDDSLSPAFSTLLSSSKEMTRRQSLSNHQSEIL
jgi:hypothetical protein